MSGTILDEIVEHKHREVAARSKSKSASVLKEQIAESLPPREFTQALQATVASGNPAVIAEVKKASPSKGVIREHYDPVAIAKSYERAGATCLSVLTDERYFQGSDDHLRAIREAVSLPVLRKEFIVDEYQVYETRAMGADCVLLIVSALDIMQLTVFHQLARSLELDVLLEVHNATELAAAVSLHPAMIGINNRNLKTFETSLDNTFSLIENIPDDVLVVTESGIRERADVAAMRARNVNAFLVGEAFMKAENPGAALTRLFS
ncbi:MAG: indole-3-glycerol phosphate synthase TrpC [Gammaproteobacteria bacterium]|nr:indole-3-glycerol phosphate synthase TrpC [Gammaproteobacteria bacterium]